MLVISHLSKLAPFNQYTVKIDGSSRVTKRNRRFLKAYTPPAVILKSSTPTRVSTNAPSNEEVLHRSPDENDHMMETPVAVTDPSPTKMRQNPDTSIREENAPRRLPLAMRRLMDYNNRGLKEIEPEDGTRRRLMRF
jgi:hypothetical protein